MKILVIGGTLFVGRHLVEAALAQGHEVTLFNRGQHNADLFPAVEKLRGDRDGGLDVLSGRQWDVVIDTCGYVPRLVRASAEHLSDAVGRYVFISTISVYRDTSRPGQDESASLGTLEDETTESVTGETYGPLKVLCEQVAEAAMPGRVLTLRPGLIVGPHDPTDRFTYWPHRIAEGGDVLAPGDAGQRVQFIDARDLAEWTVRLIEHQAVGIFNAVTADEDWTMGRLLDDCRIAAGSDARLVWVDESFLLEHGVAPWSDLPLWLAQATTDGYRGMNSIGTTNAVAAGLTYRSLAETVHDTLAWDRTRPSDTPFRGGISREREREILQAWKQSQ
jgi:2'-hydroxyisoflavone reductase